MIEILLVNRHYNSPDVPTGRMLSDLAKELLHSEHKIRVLTSCSSYTKVSCSASERKRSEEVIYLRTPGESMRFLSWVLFWLQAFLYILWIRWDRCLLMTDPPFTIIIAWMVKWLHRRKRHIYWWTMDLYPESLAAHGIINKKKLIYRFMKWMNECGLSSLEGTICLGSCQRRLLENYRNWRFMEERCIIVPPWDYRPIPNVARTHNRFLEQHGWQDKQVVLYAGNLGVAHSYTELLKTAKEFKRLKLNEWQFVFVCRGVYRKSLERKSIGLANVSVLDYQPKELTADLLWAANVHVITMQIGWEGIVVPSKLYGILKTESPVLFIGPQKTAIADEIRRYDAGIHLPSGSTSKTIVDTLLELRKAKWIKSKKTNCDGARKIARFITK